MTTSTTVTTSPDELAYDLIHYMNKLVTAQDEESEYYIECKGMVEQANFDKLLSKILESEDKIFGQSSDTGKSCRNLFLQYALTSIGEQMLRAALASLHR
jgi:hypothetical protein